MKAVLNALTLALAVLLSAGPGLADEMLSGEEIRTTLSGNTISGTMTEFGPYTEYYAPDGSIRSAYHTGTWKIDGDAACLTFDGNDAGCWHIGKDGDMLQWFQNGELLGNGTVEPGNPHDL